MKTTTTILIVIILLLNSVTVFIISMGRNVQVVYKTHDGKEFKAIKNDSAGATYYNAPPEYYAHFDSLRHQ